MGVFRNLRSLFRPAQTYVYGGDWGVHVANMDAAALYRTQPNLRAVISFLADNAAQVPLKVHVRAGQNDRPRVTDSPAALLLKQPNPDMTPFEFRRWMYSDLLLYERFLMLVLPNADSDSGWEMRPVPAPWIVGYNGASPFAPESIDVASPGNAPVRVPAERFILFHGYDPTDPMRQYSRISALKETLHEQVESNSFRRQMWQRGGRFNAYLTRPKDVQPWSEGGYERFKQTWKASWAGAEAGEGGGMPILEDGMEIRTVQFNSRDAQWADAVKLSREDVAGVYHVNPALIWPGSGQTYASAKDNARALYNDCLAPTLMQATDRLNMALLPRIGEDSSNYIVYDITIKTQGTLEERISAMQTACGVPFMTRNEVRGMLDLPSIDGGDELIVPLNVAEGGLASIHDTDPTIERYNAAPAREAGCACCQKAVGPKAEETPVSFTEGGEPVYSDQDLMDELGVTDESPKVPRKASGRPKKTEAEDMASVYKAFFERQAKSVLPKISSAPNPDDGGDDPSWWNSERWNRELADDLFEKAIKVTDAAGTRVAEKLWGDQETEGFYDSGRTEAYVRSMCERRAQMVNAATLKELQKALVEDSKGKVSGRRVSEDDEWPDEDEEGPLKDTPGGVFEHASENRSHTAGYAFATALVGWAMLEACRQNARPGEGVLKTWEVNSSNPRSSHAAMNGETVPYDEPFSNGMQWPGDIDAADASEVANCQCSLGIVAGGFEGDGENDRLSELDEDGDRSLLEEMLSTGEVTKKINPQVQRSHIEGTAEWNERVGNLDPGSMLPSSLWVDVAGAQELVDTYGGTGRIRVARHGQGNIQVKETCKVDDEGRIGYWRDENSGVESPTDRFTIHYSRTRTHIIPSKPSWLLEIDNGGSV